MPGARTAAAAAKKEYVITTKNLEKFADESDPPFSRLACCAFIEYDGVDRIQSIEDAIALRRAASGDVEGHEDELEVFVNDTSGDLDELQNFKGTVLVTTIASQSSKYPYLLKAGFVKLGEFPSNSGTHKVTLWSASPLKPGKFEPKSETREIITL